MRGRLARRVRECGPGKRAGGNTGTAPRADLTAVLAVRGAARRPGRRLRSGVLQRPAAAGAEGDDERGRAVPDPAADAVGQAGQGRARRAGHPAADRVRPPPVRRGHPATRTSRPSTSSAWSSAPSTGWGPSTRVLRYLVEHQVQLPVRVHCGPAKGELEWRRPTRETLQIMLHNPVYAGYYAYGRRQVEPRRKVPGRPSTGRVVKDAGEWLVLLPGRLPAYITAGAVRGERRADGRQPADRGHAGRAAGRVGAAVRAAALRPVRRAPHDGALPRRRPAARRPRLHVRLLPGQLRDRRPLPAHRRPRARRLRRRAGAGRGGAGRAGGLHGRRRPGRGRAGHAGQAVAAAARARPLRRRPGPPPVPARRAGEPPRRPAAGSRLGSRARRGRPAGGGLPAVHRGTPADADRRRARGDPGPGRRPPAGLGRPVHHARPTARSCCAS